MGEKKDIKVKGPSRRPGAGRPLKADSQRSKMKAAGQRGAIEV